MLMSLTHAYLHHFDLIPYTIEHILQFINSDGACVWRGGSPSSRLRANRPGHVRGP